VKLFLRTIPLLFFLGMLDAAASGAVPELPVEHFFKNYKFAQMRVSPDGRHLAALGPANGHRNLFVIDLATRKGRQLTNQGSRDISSYFWANDERIVFTMDEDGDESWGLFALNIDRTQRMTLVEPWKSKVAKGRRIVYYTEVLDRLKDVPGEILVISNRRRVEFPDVYRLDIYSGHMRRVELNPGNVVRWFTDRAGEPRAGLWMDGLERGVTWKNAAGEWQRVSTFGFGQADDEPLAVGADPRTLYVASNIGHDKRVLRALDLATGKYGPVLFEHPDADVDDVVLSRATGEPIAAVYTTDRPRWHPLDPAWGTSISGVEAALPGRLVQFVSRSQDESLAVVHAGSDQAPGTYYLLDRAKGKMEWLADVADWIDPDQMAPTRYVSIAARDGVQLHGLLTLPRGSNGGPRAMILYVHGGPFGIRDVWGFDPRVQFLANRGYAVLQVNFRGSGGYGRQFLEAGYRQWGRAMQDDLSDAVDWAVKQGVADRARIGIFGASYGGYAAMAGLALTPDQYRCGINLVGPTDIELLFDTLPRAWLRFVPRMRRTIGDPDSEGDYLDAVSPLKLAARIRAPVFMAYGERDPRVNHKHGTRMRDALERQGVPHEFIMKSDEGHGYVKEKNRLELYTRIDAFLRANLPATAQ